ncbi:uncharacterized protein LOC131940843 [Physella acuta]|uniref:uncharacterized protein LOC131940843 n=1 Tax=Physella acuta TaxID=109671 RepID=UPI0027DAF2BE|nr:uncharacterized protein LOC131940843 [Physella acuta]
MADKSEDGNGSSEDGPLYYEVEHQPKAWPVLYLGCPTEHSRYIPAPEFGLAHLPEDIRCQEVLALIRLNMELAVRLSVAMSQTCTQNIGHINQASHTMSTDTGHINQAPHAMSTDTGHINQAPHTISTDTGHINQAMSTDTGHINQAPHTISTDTGHINQAPHTISTDTGHINQAPNTMSTDTGHINQAPNTMSIDTGHINQAPHTMSIDTGHINQAPHTMSTDTGYTIQAPESKCDPYHVRGSGSVCYFSDTHDLFPCCHGDVNQCPMCHIPKCPYTETLGADHFLVSSHPVHVPDASRAHLAFRVSTNQHVVRDEADAGSTKVDLFFDSCNTRDTVKAKGVCLAGVWEEQDKVHVLCVADMNSRLQQLLQTMRQDMRRLFAAIPEEKRKSFIQNHVIIIGHPHGSAKVVSVGRKMSSGQETSPCGSLYLETRYLIETCNGSSGAPVVGPGWADGGPGYRVHCGFYRSGDIKTGISKSFWVVDSDERGGAPVKNCVPDTSGLR